MNELENNGVNDQESVEPEKVTPAFKVTETVVVNSVEEARAENLAQETAENNESEEVNTVTAPENKKRTGVAAFYDYVETFCYALALMMILFLFVFRYVSVDGDSMKHTLHDGDKLIISNLFYEPKTGDIVVINPETHNENQEPIIKRVIATGGQKVFIDYENWEVYVDGVKLDEPYIQAMHEEEMAKFGEDVGMLMADNIKYTEEFTVGEGMVFVMGDNRNNSKDSRSRDYGEMGENRILGRVIIRLGPDFGTVE